MIPGSISLLRAAQWHIPSRRLLRYLSPRQPKICVICEICERKKHLTSLSIPTREGPGRGPSLFFNTEVTDFTEYPPAHFDETDAASRQLMTRNLRTCLISLLNSATLRALTIQRGACEFFLHAESQSFGSSYGSLNWKVLGGGRHTALK